MLHHRGRVRRILALSALAMLTLLPAWGQTAPPEGGPAAGASPASPASVDAPIAVGDTVNVLVVGETLLSGDRRVAGDGTITLPLAGQIKVVGLTPARASAVIARAQTQKKQLRRPSVTVYIAAQEKPKEFTVAGAVNVAGTYALATKTTLLQALAKARGPQDGARQNAVEVTRTGVDGQPMKRSYDVTKAENANVVVQPGDYIFVPYPRRRPEVNILSILGAAGTVMYFLGRR